MNVPNTAGSDNTPTKYSFKSHVECMSRACLTGLASFGLAVSVTYFPQVLLAHRLPYPKKVFMPLAFAVGGAVAWAITSKRTRICQKCWKAHKEGIIVPVKADELQDLSPPIVK